MNTIDRLRKINEGGFGGALQAWRIHLDRWRRMNRPSKGTPPGLAFETVNRLCKEHLGDPLNKIAYVQLSGWKVSGPYRVYIEGAGGQKWQLIYKNAIYDLKDIPALKGLPIRLGPPEYTVYKQPGSMLSVYLPVVYDCREVIPGKHYQYIVEDLSQEYEYLKLTNSERSTWVLEAVNQLPGLHQALNAWVDDVDSDSLLHFDQQFAESLLVYAQNNLNSYFRVTGDPIIAELNKQWPIIYDLYKEDKVHDPINMRAIHGDLHFEHILVHKHDSTRVKILDWEWTGFGLPHFDLATLLMDQPPDLEKNALTQFAGQDKRLSFGEHERLYYFCVLERGLLNAAYIAVQQIESSRQATWGSRFINQSISRVFQSVDKLV